MEENTAKLCSLGNPLEKLLKVVDFEMFRETLEAGLYKEKLSNVGAKCRQKRPDKPGLQYDALRANSKTWNELV